MKKLIAIAIVVAAVIGGFWGYQQYQKNALVELISPMVKEVTLRTKTTGGYVTSPGNITYKEAFDGIEETIKKINELTIMVESQSSMKHPEIISDATNYLKASQSFVRNINAIIRGRFEISNAQTAAEDALAETKSGNEYTRKYALERAKKSIDKMTESRKKLLELEEPTTKSIDDLESARIKAAKNIPLDTLISDETLQGFKKYFNSEESAKP